jgi:surface carbohydrate biosynthesis protein
MGVAWVNRPRVCLVVDNPLRDLDGLVLLGWQLARRGVEAWLIPMYEQSFDVRAIGADFVLLNYVRANNLDHVMAYRREGIRVGVLDTEGVGGKTPAEFAALVASSGGAVAVDLYCVWGVAQQRALIDAGAVSEDRIQVTGCPRYDYCAAPWKNALSIPPEKPGYILVNTNFPIVNPRFSNGASEEVTNAVQAGFSRQFAEAYVRDARLAHAGMLALMETILARWPSQRFILRPHPFESHECYRGLERHANFALRQEGTSVQWLNQARALLHLNCSTAVEAAMLGKPALSPAWLDTPALHVPGPSSVSRLVASPEALLEALDAVLCSSTPQDDRQTSQPLQALRILYHHIDGHAAERVADAIVSALSQPFNPNAGPASRLKSRAVLATRGLLGHAMATRLAGLHEPSSELQRRRAKLFTLTQVQSRVGRLQTCSPQGTEVQVQAMNPGQLQRPRLASQVSIRLTAAD